MRDTLACVRKRTTIVGIATILSGLTACNDGGALSLVRPQMELSPEAGTALVFDEVVLTRTSVGPKSINIGNVGDGVLTISSAAIEGDDAAAFFVSEAPPLVLPGGNRELYVRFDPKQPGAKSAILRIQSNDPEQPDVTFPLSGPVREPCVLFADQSRVIFTVGEVKPLVIKSLSTHECVVDRIFTDRAVFAIENDPELPLTLAPGQEFTLQIRHDAVRPQFPGTPVRELRIRETEGSEQVVLLEGEPPLSHCLSAFPFELTFPQTVLGQTRRQRVTVTNRCGRSAQITSVVVGRGWTSYIVDEEYPATIGPGSSHDVWVTYVPQTEFDNGRMTINTNDAANPQFKVDMYGEAALPDVEAFPHSLDFGTVIFRNASSIDDRSECSSSARVGQIHSTGSAPLTVQQLEVAGADGLFEITGVTIDGVPVPAFNQPFEIPVNKSAQVTLQFYPTRATPSRHDGQLIVHHNGIGQVPRRILLRGDAAQDGPVEDRFRQLEGPKVDILWVIDNSCSMFDEQARLIQNLSQFIGFADSQNADYQMGVITTDSRSTEAGKLQFCYPHPRVVKHDYAEREEAFECLFMVGVNGPFLEAGLGAAMKALQRAQRVDDDPVINRNIGFLREDANLALVMMSDEDDQSLESDELLTQFFRTVKGSPDRTKVHAIAGPVSEPCGTRQAMPGIRYFQMTEAMGGVYHNICREDWQPVLQNLGLNTFVPLEQWSLSQAADPSSIVVTVNGRSVAWNETNGYTYNAADNKVRLHGLAVPQPGEELVVNYVGNCQP